MVPALPAGGCRTCAEHRPGLFSSSQSLSVTDSVNTSPAPTPAFTGADKRTAAVSVPSPAILSSVMRTVNDFRVSPGLNFNVFGGRKAGDGRRARRERDRVVPCKVRDDHLVPGRREAVQVPVGGGVPGAAVGLDPRDDGRGDAVFQVLEPGHDAAAGGGAGAGHGGQFWAGGAGRAKRRSAVGGGKCINPGRPSTRKFSVV